jgi:hypothetical protein
MRTPVTSSNLRNIGYDTDKKVLYVEFLTGGVYEYSNVEESVYEGFLKAPSPGRYFFSEVRNKYEHKKIN